MKPVLVRQASLAVHQFAGEAVQQVLRSQTRQLLQKVLAAVCLWLHLLCRCPVEGQLSQSLTQLPAGEVRFSFMAFSLDGPEVLMPAVHCNTGPHTSTDGRHDMLSVSAICACVCRQ